MSAVNPNNKFAASWSGSGADKTFWDEGNEGGNRKIFNGASGNGDKIPKGEYIIEFEPEWKNLDKLKKYPMLKEITFQLSSPVAIAMEFVNDEQALSLATDGMVKLVKKA